jgi:hypothetical protein
LKECVTSEILADFQQITSLFVSQKTELFITTAVTTSSPTATYLLHCTPQLGMTASTCEKAEGRPTGRR